MIFPDKNDNHNTNLGATSMISANNKDEYIAQSNISMQNLTGSHGKNSSVISRTQ